MLVFQHLCLEIGVRNLLPLMLAVLHVLIPLLLEGVKGFSEVIFDEKIPDEVIHHLKSLYVLGFRLDFLCDFLCHLAFSYG